MEILEKNLDFNKTDWIIIRLIRQTVSVSKLRNSSRMDQ